MKQRPSSSKSILVASLIVVSVLVLSGTAMAAEPPQGVTIIQGPDEEIMVLFAEQGILNAGLPQAVTDELLADWSTDRNPEAIYFVSPTAATEIDYALTNRTLTPYLMQFQEECDDKGGCSDKIKSKSKTLSMAYNGVNSYSVSGNLNGNLTFDANLSGTATGIVTYRIKRKKVLGVCIPYGIRFEHARAYGNGQANGELTVDGAVSYSNSWSWEKQIAKPSLGAITFWVGPVWVKIGFNLPITGGVILTVNANANLDVDADINASGSFDYTCTLSSCSGSASYNVQGPSPQLSASINGRADVRPWLQGAVRAYLYTESIAYAQVGVRPMAYADVWGYYGNTCGDADGDGTNEWVDALTLDLDGRVFLTAQADSCFTSLKKWDDLWHTNRYHLAWVDLIGSDALTPMLIGPTSANVGTLKTYQARMRPCYPYADMMSYTVNWGDGYSHPFSSPPATPHNVYHCWSTTGFKTVTLTAENDSHGRNLNKTTTRTVRVNCRSCPVEDEVPID